MIENHLLVYHLRNDDVGICGLEAEVGRCFDEFLIGTHDHIHNFKAVSQ